MIYLNFFCDRISLFSVWTRFGSGRSKRHERTLQERAHIVVDGHETIGQHGRQDTGAHRCRRVDQSWREEMGHG